MGNKESQNKDTISKLQQFQQSQANRPNMNQYYTNQNLGVYDDERRAQGNPWDQQQQYQAQPPVQMQPTKQISGIKNEIFLHKDSLKLVPLAGSVTDYGLTFNFDSMHECQISIHQGCLENIADQGGRPTVTFTPMQNTVFEAMPIPVAKFSEGKNQQFPDNVVAININNYFNQGDDFTKAFRHYFPLVINMRSTSLNAYESIYYLQYQFSRLTGCKVLMIKQKVLYNGQLFDLTEAYGLNSNRTDEVGTQECVICLTNPKDTLSTPCKHVSLCHSCAQVVMQHERKCPICRQGKINELI